MAPPEPVIYDPVHYDYTRCIASNKRMDIKNNHENHHQDNIYISPPKVEGLTE